MGAPLIIQPGGPQPAQGLSLGSGDGEYTTLQQVQGGLVTGFREIPVVGWAFGKALQGSGLLSEEQMVGLQQAAASGPVGQVTSLVAEWAPQLLVGGALVNAAKTAALQAVGTIGGAALGGVEGAAALRAAALAGATAETAPFLQRIMGGPLGKQLADVVLMNAGKMLPLTGPPAILRTAEVLANASIFGAFSTSDALLEGKPLVESVEEGARAALLAGGIEGAFTLAAKALLPGARTLDRGMVAAAAKNNPEYQAFIKGELEGLAIDVSKASERMKAASEQLAHIKMWSKELGADEVEKVLGVETAELIAEMQRSKEALRTARAAKRAVTGILNEDAAWLPMVSGTLRGSAPIGEGSREALAQKFLLQYMQTPEQVSKKLGVSGAKLMEALRRAEGEHATSKGAVTTKMLRTAQQAHGVLGVESGKSGGKFLTEWVDAAQGGKGGLRKLAAAKGMSKQQAEEVSDLFFGMQGEVNALHQELRKVGVEPLPLKGSIPFVLRDDMTEEALGKAIRTSLQKGGLGWEEAEQTAGRIMGARRGRNRMFDLQDAVNELLPGRTFGQLVKDGFPIVDDPLVALQTYLGSGYRRVAYARNLGPNEEVAKVLVGAVKREGGSSALAQDMVNAALLKDYGDNAGRLFAAGINNLQVATKMTFAVIPNATQSVLTAVQHGPLQTLRFLAPKGKALTRLPGGQSLDEAVTAVGLNDTILSAYREAYLDPNMRTPLGWLADGIFHYTGFNRVEAWNRKAAAATAMYDTGRTLVMLAEGRLKGATLAKASRRLEAVGLNPEKVSATLRKQMAFGMSPDEAVADLLNVKGGDLLKRVAWRGAQQTQFLPSPSRKPNFWHSPTGSVMFQFKSFALSHARFVRDAVLAEAAKGNPGPLARLLVLAPPSGELVMAARELTGGRGHQEHGLARAAADMAAVGGLGLVSDVAMAARGNRLLSMAAGPTGTDVSRLLESLAGDNSTDRIAAHVSRWPAMRAVSWLKEPLGAVTAGSLSLLREHTATTADDSEAITLAQLREFSGQP